MLLRKTQEDRLIPDPAPGILWMAMKTKAQEAGQQAREHISQWTSHAQDSLEEWKSRASSQSYQFRSMAQERGQRVKGEFERYLQDSPLTVGMMTIAIGAAIGFSYPVPGRRTHG